MRTRWSGGQRGGRPAWKATHSTLGQAGSHRPCTYRSCTNRGVDASAPRESASSPRYHPPPQLRQHRCLLIHAWSASPKHGRLHRVALASTPAIAASPTRSGGIRDQQPAATSTLAGASATPGWSALRRRLNSAAGAVAASDRRTSGDARRRLFQPTRPPRPPLPRTASHRQRPPTTPSWCSPPRVEAPGPKTDRSDGDRLAHPQYQPRRPSPPTGSPRLPTHRSALVAPRAGPLRLLDHTGQPGQSPLPKHASTAMPHGVRARRHDRRSRCRRALPNAVRAHPPHS